MHKVSNAAKKKKNPWWCHAHTFTTSNFYCANLAVPAKLLQNVVTKTSAYGLIRAASNSNYCFYYTFTRLLFTYVELNLRTDELYRTLIALFQSRR